jgi:anhydro-N-acetylmuramic acid kinase
MSANSLYVGCMTGTSVDGLDLALIEVNGSGAITIVAADTLPLPDPLRRDLLALSQPEDDDIDLLGTCDQELGRFTATAINTFIKRLGYASSSIRAIGSHGQTIRHRPPGTTSLPFTLQIGDPHVIAETTGITTVADFRRRDIAAGGHGAPLVPRFHAELFNTTVGDNCILNIGGISNVSLLSKNLTGFDTGPGNALLDQWCQQHQGLPYDRSGAWSAGGRVDNTLLEVLLADPFFALQPPKSTGREYFNLDWLNRTAGTHDLPLDAAQDIQATLTQLTATTVIESLKAWGGDIRTLVVCGGGRLNNDLMHRLRLAAAELAQTPDLIEPSEYWGVDGDAIEAAAFAWLAHRRLEHLPGNVPAVTGAAGERVLGAVY